MGVRSYSKIHSMGMTNRDDVHLARLRDHFARYGAMPSYGEMKEVLGFRSKSPAQKLATRLKQRGLLDTAPGGKLVPKGDFFARPLVMGSVRAGAPDAPEGVADADPVTLDRYLIEQPSTTVLVRIKGDSMQDAGMLEGDLAVVHRGIEARAGDIVVAIVDEAFTVKELKYERGQPLLVPHNRKYPVVRPSRTLEIYGVVIGLVRRLQRSRATKAEF